MPEKQNLYPNLAGLLHQLESEKENSKESSDKSEISESPPGYDEIFSYISYGYTILKLSA